ALHPGAIADAVDLAGADQMQRLHGRSPLRPRPDATMPPVSHIAFRHQAACRRATQAIAIIGASTARRAPGRTWIPPQVASRLARSTFSIFIASTTASGSPAFTA